MPCSMEAARKAVAGSGSGQGAFRGAVAGNLGHLIRGQNRRIGCEATGGKRLGKAAAAANGEIHMLEAVDKGDAAVTQIQQKFCGAVKGAAVVHIDPVIVQLGARSTAMHDKGHSKVAQHTDAGVVGFGRVDDDTVDGATRHEVAVGAFLGLVGHDGQDHVIAVAGIGLARTCDEIGKDRVHDFAAGVQRDDVTHSQGAPGGQTDRAGIGAIVVATRGGHDPFAGGLVHLGVAVQRPADRGRRQAEFGGQFLEVHLWGAKPVFLCIAAK